MIRLEDTLSFKPEESANKFELLVTSGHDRIFGDMVKAQQAEERKKKEAAYRERKLAERKKREKEGKGDDKKEEVDEKEGKKEGKKDEIDGKEEKKEDKEGKKDDKEGKKDEKAEPDEREQEGDEVKVKHPLPAKPLLDVAPGEKLLQTPAPGTPASNVAVKDGEEIKREFSPMVGAADGKGHAVIAVPIAGEAIEEAEGKKHEVEAMAAIPKDVEEKKESKVDEVKGKEEKPREKIDPMRDAELLAKMIQASGGGPDGPVGIDDIKLAFKALERAADSAMAGPTGDGNGKNKGPIIWTWSDRCERWRWRNFEAGVHEVGPGGWEERDWKVFADDRGCEEFEEEEEDHEIEEEDVHDWTC